MFNVKKKKQTNAFSLSFCESLIELRLSQITSKFNQSEFNHSFILDFLCIQYLISRRYLRSQESDITQQLNHQHGYQSHKSHVVEVKKSKEAGF